jgi:acetyltransferase-like isoleucine patch superfamily enzyme
MAYLEKHNIIDMGFTQIMAECLYAPFRSIRFMEQAANECRFRSRATVSKNACLLPGAKIFNCQNNPAAIVIGADTAIRGELFVFGHGGGISIGKWGYVGEGTRIWSAEKIDIGDRVLIAHNVNIHDNDSHPLACDQRHQHYKNIMTSGHPQAPVNISSSPVTIEDDVWIGFGAVILKGVTIGKGSIIGAGSLITKDVPEKSTIVQSRWMP